MSTAILPMAEHFHWDKVRDGARGLHLPLEQLCSFQLQKVLMLRPTMWL
jgi:hypothetical protein